MPSTLQEADSDRKRKETDILCPNCGVPFTARIKREWYIKYLLFLKPARRYVCGCCRSNFYIIQEKF